MHTITNQFSTNTNTNNLTLKFNNEIVGEIPIDALASKAPVYDRKWIKKELPSEKINIKNLKKIKLEDALILKGEKDYYALIGRKTECAWMGEDNDNLPNEVEEFEVDDLDFEMM